MGSTVGDESVVVVGGGWLSAAQHFSERQRMGFKRDREGTGLRENE
jgi:hypothetical protein